MGLIDYTLDGHIAVVTMDRGENRFNFDFFDSFHQILNEIENKTSASVLVVKSGHEKIWSNGIDLEWAMDLAQTSPEDAKKFPYELAGLYKRLLYYPMVTIAAINGHAFAAGAILASAFDFRFMRSDRGYFCLPEIDIKIPLWPSLIALMRKVVPEYKFHEMQLLGIRMTAEECEKHHIVMKACHGDDLMGEVMNFARPHDKGRNMIGIMKKLTFKHFEEIFEKEDPEWFSSGMTGLE